MSIYYQFHRKIWEKEYFSDLKPTSWRCGKCGVGQLKANVDLEKKMHRSRESQTFSSQLRCTESTCDSSYYAVGHWAKYNKYNEKISITYEGKDCERRFAPIAFIPTVSMFACSPDTPVEITQSLDEAFKLYWISAAACANAIRTVLERLMNARAISGDRLNNKLNSFRQNDQVNGDRLLAIKWIGNSGSHDSDLKRSDVLDGFEILVEVLLSLYPDTSKSQRIDGIVASINSSKKPRSKQP